MATHGEVRWCAHPKFFRNEILTSWLHRYAWRNGLTGHCFAVRVFGSRPIWTRDIDRSVSDEILTLAASALQVDCRDVRATTLVQYEGTVFKVRSVNGWLPWVTPAGVYHRTRRHHGSAYCALCLQERPCALVQWRLAWFVHCPRHEVPLRDACPQCDAPFVFHRISLAVAGRFACPTCGHNFAKHVGSAPVSMRARRLQRALTAACLCGYRSFAGETISAMEYTGGIRLLLGGLYGKSTWHGIADALPRMLRGEMTCQAPSRLPFEHWRIHDRARALALLATALEDWPKRFLVTCRRGPVYRARFGRLANAPGWVIQALTQIR